MGYEPSDVAAAQILWECLRCGGGDCAPAAALHAHLFRVGRQQQRGVGRGGMEHAPMLKQEPHAEEHHHVPRESEPMLVDEEDNAQLFETLPWYVLAVTAGW